MIERDIYLNSYRVFEPINVVEGNAQYPIKLNVKDVSGVVDTSSFTTSYEIKAYSKTALGTFVCAGSISDDNKSILVSPPAGFFIEGENWFQIEIIEARSNSSQPRVTFTFPMKVIADKNLFSDTASDATKADIANQVLQNTADIAELKEQTAHVNSGIEVTQAEYETIRESAEYDPEATYFINDIDSPEKEVYLTRAQYDALRQTSEYSPSTKYFITDEDGAVGAEAVSYGDGSVADELGKLSAVFDRIHYLGSTNGTAGATVTLNLPNNTRFAVLFSTHTSASNNNIWFVYATSTTESVNKVVNGGTNVEVTSVTYNNGNPYINVKCSNTNTVRIYGLCFAG